MLSFQRCLALLHHPDTRCIFSANLRVIVALVFQPEQFKVHGRGDGLFNARLFEHASVEHDLARLETVKPDTADGAQRSRSG